MPTVRLTWTDLNSGAIQEDEIRVYRSETDFDEGSLPAVLATLDADTVTYDDTTADDDTTYYYAVSAVRGAFEAVSPTIEVIVGEPAPPPNWSIYYDTTTGVTVAGAWGLRKLVSGYTGSAVRIKDTNGGAEQDVGFGPDGYLDDFTVTGSAAVVTLYDQSGNGANLTPNVADQVLVVRGANSISGRPALKFNGSSGFLRDPTTGTARPYMVAFPIIALEAASVSGAAAFAAWAAIPTTADTNTTTASRWAILRRTISDNQLDIRLSGSSSSASNPRMELLPEISIGSIFVCAQIDRLIDGSQSLNGPRGVGDNVTYPNATRLYIGNAGNASTTPSPYEVTALTILSDSAATEATVIGWHDTIHQRGLAVPLDDKVLDVTFSVDPPVDTSDLVHPVWLSNGASISGGALSPGSAGAAIVAPSGPSFPSGDFTFEIEVNLSSLVTGRHIAGRRFNQQSTNRRGWALTIDDTNSDELRLNTDNGSELSHFSTTSANLTTGVWYTIRITRSGTTWKIYVDGVERASATPSNQPAYNAVPTIIGNNTARSLPFPGTLRNAKMWSGVALVP